MKKMMLKADEKNCLNAIAEYEAKIDNGTASWNTKFLLLEAVEKLAKIKKELSELRQLQEKLDTIFSDIENFDPVGYGEVEITPEDFLSPTDEQ